MKYMLLYCLYISSKHSLHLWFNSAGTFKLWLMLLYLAPLAFLFAMPFKREVKFILAILMMSDALAPLVPNNILRVIALGVSVPWMCSYLVRRLRQGEEISPWATSRGVEDA